MALQISGQSFKTGAPGQALPQDQQNALLVSELAPRYYVNAYSGNIFSVCQTAAAALAAVGTGVTGLTLFNPTGSGKNLILVDIGVGLTPVTLATVGITVVLAGVAQAATPTGLSSLTPATNLVGAGFLPVAKTYSAATLSTAPTIMRVVGNWSSTALTTSGGATSVPAFIKDEVAGAVVVAPGAAICLAGIGTVADATVAASMTWIELPV
jgi:hypothetical protein